MGVPKITRSSGPKVLSLFLASGRVKSTVSTAAPRNGEDGQVCDTLDIVLNRGDGSCQELVYQLDDQEREILLKKMQDYCIHQEGLTLEDYGLRLQEEPEPLTSQTVQQM